MRIIARIFLALSVCLISVTCLGKIHTEEELARINHEYDEIRRTIDGFSKNLSDEELSKYKALTSALESYASSHSVRELYSSGTGNSDAVIAAERSVQREFIDHFTTLEKKQFKSQLDSDFKRKDEELNQIYQDLQKNKNLDTEVEGSPIMGYPSRSGIRQTQRNWIRYRHAWLAFAKLKFPTVSKDSLSAALTSDRIAKLKNIKEY